MCKSWYLSEFRLGGELDFLEKKKKKKEKKSELAEFPFWTFCQISQKDFRKHAKPLFCNIFNVTCLLNLWIELV